MAQVASSPRAEDDPPRNHIDEEVHDRLRSRLYDVRVGAEVEAGVEPRCRLARFRESELQVIPDCVFVVTDAVALPVSSLVE